MSVINKRNAVVGWVVWSALKSVGKRKASDAKPSIEGGRPNKSLIAVVIAATAGAFAVLIGRRAATD